jgi:hypothetical protein
VDARDAALTVARAPRRAQLAEAFDRFCFDPIDLRLIGVLRIGYALLLGINVLAWAPDLLLFFGESGVMPFETARALSDPDTPTLFAVLPHSDGVVQLAYAILLAHIVLLGIGWKARLQAVATYVWLVSFQNRHMMLFDGEDNVFRLLGLALIFLPLAHCCSLDAWLRRRRGDPLPRRGSAWALRLIQFQMTVIYASTAWEKLLGNDWVDGNALYYVSRLDDLFGHYPIPASILESLGTLQLMTWSVLATELSLPLLLWLPRTRRLGMLLALGLHLGIEYAMTLFLFQWVMLLGLLSFVRDEDIAALRGLVARLRRPRRL